MFAPFGQEPAELSVPLCHEFAEMPITCAPASLYFVSQSLGDQVATSRKIYSFQLSRCAWTYSLFRLFHNCSSCLDFCEGVLIMCAYYCVPLCVSVCVAVTHSVSVSKNIAFLSSYTVPV